MIDIKNFILNILKDNIDPDIKYTTGKQNEDIEKSIFISNKDSDNKNKLYNPTFFTQELSLILNWNDNYTETREVALEIYEFIEDIENVLYDENTLIVRCVMHNDFPSDINSNKKIYSQKIDFQLQYCTK